MAYEYVDEQPKSGRYEFVDAPASVEVGGAINKSLRNVARTPGLSARYALEGLANTAQIFTEPLRYLTDSVIPGKATSVPLGVLATQFANKIGLPSPEGANERVIGDATRLGYGAIGGGKVAQVLGGAGSDALQFVGKNSEAIAQSVGQKFAQTMAVNPLQQVGSAAGAGLAGGASREAGGGEWMQAGAAVLGGLAGGVAAGAAPAVFDSGYNLWKNLRGTNMTTQQLDAKIGFILKNTGVDYSEVPEKIRQSMRAEMAGSLKADKEFSPEAVARLLDFKRVGATPTRGMVSQDPIQITREMNLAKTGANSSDSALHGMALLQNQNNKTLIRNMNDAGALNGDPFAAGQSTIGAINSRNDASGKIVSGLYDSARAMPGGNTQLDRKPFVDGIYGALAKENKMAYLPEDISNTINSISAGQVTRNGQTFKVPFDANALDNLMTDIATAQRGTSDGNIKRALTLARQAIDGTQLAPIKGQSINGAADFMDAVNLARGAAKSRFGWQESSKPIEAALGGVEPDKFIQRFVINGSLSDAESIAKNAGSESVKNAIVAHLKGKAIGSADDDFGKFSQAAYKTALAQIGDRKLAVFFSPTELEQLKAVGRVASAMQVQPIGSAVNNSNSGAMLIGKGYDALKGGIGMIPGVGPVTAGLLDLTLGNPTKGAANWLGQRAAENAKAGLLLNQAEGSNLKNLLLPGIAMGGLLAAP